jgi:hypothetical protein
LGRVVHFDDPCDGYPLNTSPSAIRDVDGRLYFGTRAIQMNEGENYGSLKADLLAPPEEPKDRLELEILTATYIAWALQSIFAQDEQLAADDPIVQFSAPTSHAGDEQLKQIFLRIAHAAYSVARNESRLIKQGMHYSDSFNLIKPILNSEIPSSEERKFFVLPETVAPIVSLQLEPFLETGIYLIADMGASTTEMSVFAVNDSNNENSILGYFDLTEIRGGNDLAEFDQMEVGRSQDNLDVFLDAVKKQADKVWYIGYQKDMNNPAASQRWKQLEVLLTGGATHHKNVRAHFDKKIKPINAWPENDTNLSIGRHEPTTLTCDSCRDEPDLSLFAVANGLAIEGPRWPRFFPEHEIDELDSIDSSKPERVVSPRWV